MTTDPYTQMSQAHLQMKEREFKETVLKALTQQTALLNDVLAKLEALESKKAKRE